MWEIQPDRMEDYQTAIAPSWVARGEVALQEALHSMRTLLCTATDGTPHERMFRFQRIASFDTALPAWLQTECRFCFETMYTTKAIHCVSRSYFGRQPLLCTYTTWQRTRRYCLYVRPRSLSECGIELDMPQVIPTVGAEVPSTYEHPRWRTVGWSSSAEIHKRRWTWCNFNKWRNFAASDSPEIWETSWQSWRNACSIAIVINSATSVWIIINNNGWICV